MWITPAFAQGAGGAGGAGIMQFLPLILIFVIFYFLLIRPQMKREKDRRKMIEALKRGDKVVTQGGLIGTVAKVENDGILSIEIADGVRVKFDGGKVEALMSKTEPRKDKDEESSEGKGGNRKRNNRSKKNDDADADEDGEAKE